MAAATEAAAGAAAASELFGGAEGGGGAAAAVDIPMPLLRRLAALLSAGRDCRARHLAFVVLQLLAVQPPTLYRPPPVEAEEDAAAFIASGAAAAAAAGQAVSLGGATHRTGGQHPSAGAAAVAAAPKIRLHLGGGAAGGGARSVALSGGKRGLRVPPARASMVAATALLACLHLPHPSLVPLSHHEPSNATPAERPHSRPALQASAVRSCLGKAPPSATPARCRWVRWSSKRRSGSSSRECRQRRAASCSPQCGALVAWWRPFLLARRWGGRQARRPPASSSSRRPLQVANPLWRLSRSRSPQGQQPRLPRPSCVSRCRRQRRRSSRSSSRSSPLLRRRAGSAGRRRRRLPSSRRRRRLPSRRGGSGRPSLTCSSSQAEPPWPPLRQTAVPRQCPMQHRDGTQPQGRGGQARQEVGPGRGCRSRCPRSSSSRRSRRPPRPNSS